MKIQLHVRLKDAVLDPQGKASLNALRNLGHNKLLDIRQGKFFIIDLDEDDVKIAYSIVEKICIDLLVNPVMEEYSISILERS